MKIVFKAKSLKMAKIRANDKHYTGSIQVKELKKPTRNSMGKYCAIYKLRKT